MALSYIGGKSKIGYWIRNYIPNDTKIYVEPFSGMFWVFFKLELSRYKNLEKVVYNEVNPLNVNLFNCLKESVKLWDLSKDLPIEDDKIFAEFKSEIFNPDLKLDTKVADFEIAYKYAYVLSQVWSGTDPKKGNLIKNGGYVAKNGLYKSKFEIFRTKLIDVKWQKYFDKITNVENLDFEEVIKKYDSKKTYFYCDPPYFLTENYYTNHDFTLDTHERLAKSLGSIKGKFGLSYYYFDKLDQWFPKNEFSWQKKEFAKTAMAVSGKSQTKGVELLIMNYGKTHQQEQKTVIIEGDDFDFSI
jgi:DNA adenine methylase